MKYIMYAIAISVTFTITEFIIFPVLFDDNVNSFVRILVNIVLSVIAILLVEYLYKVKSD